MSNRPAKELKRTFSDFIACGTLFLGLPSFVAIMLILSLLKSGVSPELIEKGMVWLSVPWFALCYVLCKVAHGIELVVDKTPE